MSAPIITRFAPSPTGFLHIGGARTALFNWLYAKRMNGQMLLRIEDTDRTRSNPQAVTAILEGLSWLGLTWDGAVISQYERASRHCEVAHELVRLGKAYYCYCTPQELEAMREAATANGQQPRYDGRWRDKVASDAPSDMKPVIRIKAPQEGETIVHDSVQGEVRFPNKDLDDFIILRSDQSPTYMHAVVVDDHDAGVTHIIRGDDHLTNAARQTIIYEAMGWRVPNMSHIPLIHGNDGAKLSKRHGALGIEAYREMGYLPHALLNYLVRLGWSHGDDEIMSRDEMISWFDIKDINKGASRFDFDKLDAINGHYIRQSEDSELCETLIKTLPHLSSGQQLLDNWNDQSKELLIKAMRLLKERAKTLNELAESASFLFSKRPLKIEEKAQLQLNDAGKTILRGIYPVLSKIVQWDTQTIDSAVRAYGIENSLKLGQVAGPLRAALTGKSTAPGVSDLLELLGIEQSLARIKDQINAATS
jgi:glutamyl-tRNA synthetase